MASNVFMFPTLGFEIEEAAIPKPAAGCVTCWQRDDGSIWYKLPDGSIAQAGGGGGGSGLPAGQFGALYYSNGDGTITALPAGTAGQVLGIVRANQFAPAAPGWTDLAPAQSDPQPAGAVEAAYEVWLAGHPNGSVAAWIASLAPAASSGGGGTGGGGTGGGGTGGGSVGATQLLTGTFSASSTYGGGYDASLMWDGDTSNRGLTAQSDSAPWVQLDLGSTVQAVVQGVRVWVGSDPAQIARGGNLSIEVSMDGSTWVVLGGVGPATPNGMTETDFATNTQACRYVRAYCNAAYSDGSTVIDLAELQFLGGILT